jgi:hypothetical protein
MVSTFQALMRKFKADPKSVIWFHVYKDSLETYLAVRDVADQLGMPVGWDLYYNAFYTRPLLPEFAVAHTPPPATAPKPPGAGGAVINIAAPKTVLD